MGNMSSYENRIKDLTTKSQEYSVVGQILSRRGSSATQMALDSIQDDILSEASSIQAKATKEREKQAKAQLKKQVVQKLRTPAGENKSPISIDATNPKYMPQKPFSEEVEYPGTSTTEYLPPPKDWSNIPYQQLNPKEPEINWDNVPYQQGNSFEKTPSPTEEGNIYEKIQYLSNASQIYGNTPVAGGAFWEAMRNPQANSSYTVGGGLPQNNSTSPIDGERKPGGMIERIGDSMVNATATIQQQGSTTFPRYNYTGPIDYKNYNSRNGVNAGEIEEYIRRAAQQRGVNEEDAIKVVMGEGGLQNPVLRNYNNEPAWGPFQLHVAAEDFRPGFERDREIATKNPNQGYVGDQFIGATGLHPSDPKAWKMAVEFALDKAIEAGSWAAWYGAKSLPNGRYTRVTGQKLGFSQEAKEYAGAK